MLLLAALAVGRFLARRFLGLRRKIDNGGYGNRKIDNRWTTVYLVGALATVAGRGRRRGGGGRDDRLNVVRVTVVEGDGY